MATTEFEANGGTAWTTWAGEAAYLYALESEHANVTVTRLIDSQGGIPIHLVRVGGAGPDGHVMFVNGQPHGDEPAGRESTYVFLRELAESTDPAVIEYLSTHTVYAVPTINPDGRDREKRNYVNDVDSNRDWTSLSCPETRAVAEVIGRVDPEVIVDLHENVNETELDMRALSSTNPQVPNAIRDLGAQMVTDVLADLQGDGYTTGGYNGDFLPSILRNTGGLRYAITVVVEGRHLGTLAARALMVKRFLWASLRWHAANGATILNARSAGIAQARSKAQSGASYYIDNDVIVPSPVYRLTRRQEKQFEVHAAAYGIELVPVSPGVSEVALDQDAYPLIPFLLDGRSPYRAITKDGAKLPLVHPTSWYLRVDGRIIEATRVSVLSGGEMFDVWKRK